jgi:putative ABC transport system permease protein
MVLRRFTFREVKSRPGRALLTLGSIVIGVAAVVAVNVSTITTREATQDMYQSMAGRSALEIVAEGGGTYDAGIVPVLEKVPGVKAASPVLQQFSKLTFKGSSAQFMIMGIDPTRDDAVREYHQADGEFIGPKVRGGMLETGFARGLGIGVGDEVKIRTSSSLQMQRVGIVGLLSPEGAAGFRQGGVMFLPLDAVQVLFKKPNGINNISLVLDANADEDAVKAAVAAELPVGVAVRSPLARAQASKDVLQNVELGLNFAYWLTLVLAGFMILNTFLMNVGERRKQLSILRAIGTTRGQVMRMLLTEGALMGIVGTILGCLLGLAGAYSISAATGKFYGTGIPTLRITAAPFILAATLGPGLGVLAMFIPARLAGKVSPLEGMRPMVTESSKAISPWSIIVGAVMFVGTGCVLAGCVMRYLPIALTIYAGVAFTAAFVMLIPAMLGITSRLLTWLLSPILGTEGRLGQRQILRRRTRTTLTVGVLYIAVSTAIGVGTMILISVQNVRDWQERTFDGDFFIRAMLPDMATSEAGGMPETLGPTLRQVEGVTNVETLSTVSNVHVNDMPVTLALRDFNKSDKLPLLLTEGKPDEVRRRLYEGEVVLGSVLAHRLAIRVGDEITLRTSGQTESGERKVHVAGIATEYMSGGLIVQMERNTGKKLFNVDGVSVFMVTADPHALANVEARMQDICKENGLMCHSFADLRVFLNKKIDGVVGSLWAVLALGLVIAAFGIANTLAMNVLEQTRELALLRVVAMTRRQVRKTILAQATIVGMLGLTIGVVGGVIGSYITNLSYSAILGNPIQFAFHPMLVLVVFGFSLAVVLAAAWIPAARAARLNLLIALQYE